MSAPSRASMPRQRGFTLIELMVGLVIGLLIGLAAFGSSQFLIATQRQSVSVGSALGESSNALSSLRYELAQSGLGFYMDGTLLCPLMNLSFGATAFSTAQAFLPLRVSNDAVTGLSTLDSVFAQGLEATAPASTDLDTTLAGGTASLASYLSVATTQAVLLMPPAGVARPCTVRTVTAVTPSTATTSQILAFSNAGTHNKVAFTDVAYPLGSRVLQLGALQWSRFRVVDGGLVMERPLQGTRAVLVKDVVAFQAQYGISAGGVPGLNSWQPPAGAWQALTGANLTQIVAVRVGVVVRSPMPVKPAADGSCSTTVDQPVLFDQPLALDGNWRCYRYRVNTVVVPLRNVQLGASAP